jgi:ABC-type glycerol-3-phosphate transport system substrate-binding protein
MKKLIALLLSIIIAFSLMLPTTAVGKATPAPKIPEFKKAPIIRIMEKDANILATIAASKLSLKDNPYVRYIYKNTGINVQVELFAEDSYLEKIQLQLMSKDASDLVFLTGADSYAINTAKSGALKPLNKYLPKYPNLVKVYNKAFWAEYAFDKNQYYLMQPYPLPVANKCTLIRQDWLDKLKLKMPTTVQELHDVLKAFVQAEPDGKHPTYGLTGRTGNDNFYALTPAYGNPNVDTGLPYIYVDFATKKLVLWQTTNAARAYFKEIVKWYRENLIDKEFLTNNTDTFFSKAYNGITGTISHNAESAAWITTECRLIQKSTTPLLSVIPALSGTGFKNPYGGTGGTEKVRSFDGYWGISTYSKNVDNVMKVLNFECSPAFNDFVVYGQEGLEYNKKNGVPVVDDTYLHDKSFYGQYVFTYDMSSFTANQNDRLYKKYDGGGNPQYDPESDALARSRAAYITVGKTAVPYQAWPSIVPLLPVEDLHPDVISPLKELMTKLTIGDLDANKDADWKAFLKAVNDTGINDVVKAKEAWLKKNAPKYLTRF